MSRGTGTIKRRYLLASLLFLCLAIVIFMLRPSTVSMVELTTDSNDRRFHLEFSAPGECEMKLLLHRAIGSPNRPTYILAEGSTPSQTGFERWLRRMGWLQGEHSWTVVVSEMPGPPRFGAETFTSEIIGPLSVERLILGLASPDGNRSFQIVYTVREPSGATGRRNLLAPLRSRLRKAFAIRK
jgi:hypothetical protein